MKGSKWSDRLHFYSVKELIERQMRTFIVPDCLCDEGVPCQS